MCAGNLKKYLCRKLCSSWYFLDFTEGKRGPSISIFNIDQVKNYVSQIIILTCRGLIILDLRTLRCNQLQYYCNVLLNDCSATWRGFDFCAEQLLCDPQIVVCGTKLYLIIKINVCTHSSSNIWQLR